MALSPSSDFIDTLRFGALLVVGQVTVFEYSDAGEVIQQLDVPISVATITADRNSATRRTGTVTAQFTPSIPVDPMLPTKPGDPLTPFGNEVNIAFGLATGNAGAVPLAVLAQAAGEYADEIVVDSIAVRDLLIEVGSTVVVGNSVPLTVTAIAGAGPYVLKLNGGLTHDQPAGTLVQLTQFIPCGQFVITETDVQASSNQLTVSLSLSDRSFVLNARTLTAPYTLPATQSGTYQDEVMALLNMAWGTYSNIPPLQYNFAGANNPVVPTGHYGHGQSPWQLALDLAQVAGNELYFDENGIVCSHTYPNVQTAAVKWWFTDQSASIYSSPTKTVASGSPYTVPIEVRATFTRQGIFNEVFVTGSGSQNAPGASSSSSTGTGHSTSATSSSPVLAHAADFTVGSATYVDGALGPLPEFVSSNLVPTASQAQAMASLDLAMSISSAWQVTITTQPNPLIDIDDVVSVLYPSVGVVGPGGLGLCMVVDSITMSVTYADSMEITGRVIPGRYA
ncbi:MAG: hypothetical protein KGL39_04325 [Patescibacteria group bacterium]|nr:hypothetical protein [Patescibacteria group bacterium]